MNQLFLDESIPNCVLNIRAIKPIFRHFVFRMRRQKVVSRLDFVTDSINH